MTLILSSINRRQAIQVSDRRSTAGNGTWVDNLNKTFVCICEDARVIVGFTGLAKAHDFVTYQWIGETMMEALKSGYFIEPALRRFASMATDRFLDLSTTVNDEDRRLSVAFTGYRYEGNSPRAYIWLVSNYDTLDEDEPSEMASGRFIVSSYREKQPGEKEIALVWINGMDAAISDKQLSNFGECTRQESEQGILEKGLQLIRHAADSQQSKDLISKDCSSIALSARPEVSARSRFHTDNSGGDIFIPGILIARKKEGIYFMAEAVVSNNRSDLHA